MPPVHQLRWQTGQAVRRRRDLRYGGTSFDGQASGIVFRIGVNIGNIIIRER